MTDEDIRSLRVLALLLAASAAGAWLLLAWWCG